MKCRLLLLAYAVILIGLAAQFGPMAFACFSVYTPSTDVELLWPLKNSYSISIDLKIVSSPENNTSIFWGHMFSFMNSQQGYVGFGLGGNLKVATVAVFGAINGTTDNPTGYCGVGVPFSSSGIGWQCFITYDWNLNNDYSLTFAKQTTDSAGNIWWQATILDHSTNSTTAIGDVLVPPYFGLLGSVSSTWDEYSAATTCNVVDTKAIFSSPYEMNTAGNHAPTKALVTYGNATCPDSNVRFLGSGAYEIDAGANTARTTAKQTYLWTREPPTTISDAQTSTLAVPTRN